MSNSDFVIRNKDQSSELPKELHLPFKFKTYGFVIAIIVGIGGLAVVGVGLSGYLQVGALSNLGQIHSIIMMAAGGGGALLIGAIVAWVKKEPTCKRIRYEEVYSYLESLPQEKQVLFLTQKIGDADHTFLHKLAMDSRQWDLLGSIVDLLSVSQLEEVLTPLGAFNDNVLHRIAYRSNMDLFLKLVTKFSEKNEPLPRPWTVRDKHGHTPFSQIMYRNTFKKNQYQDEEGKQDFKNVFHSLSLPQKEQVLMLQEGEDGLSTIFSTIAEKQSFEEVYSYLEPFPKEKQAFFLTQKIGGTDYTYLHNLAIDCRWDLLGRAEILEILKYIPPQKR